MVLAIILSSLVYEFLSDVHRGRLLIPHTKGLTTNYTGISISLICIFTAMTFKD